MVLKRMNEYNVLIHGTNVLLEFEGNFYKGGFYTGRIVEAQDPQSAERLAIQNIWETSDLIQTALNSEEDPLKMEAEEIKEVFEPEEIALGLAFYIETDDDEISYVTKA